MDILQRPSPNHGGALSPTVGMIVHTTRGGKLTPTRELRSTLGYFANPDSQTSAHYVVHVDGTVYECVEPARVAWHARFHNTQWLGVELVQARITDAITEEQYMALAELTRWLSSTFGFPLDREHIRGHEEMLAGIQDGKSDPGPQFDWQRFMALLTSEEEAEDMGLAEARAIADGSYTEAARNLWQAQIDDAQWGQLRSVLNTPGATVADLCQAIARERWDTMATEFGRLLIALRG